MRNLNHSFVVVFYIGFILLSLFHLALIGISATVLFTKTKDLINPPAIINLENTEWTKVVNFGKPFEVVWNIQRNRICVNEIQRLIINTDTNVIYVLSQLERPITPSIDDVNVKVNFSMPQAATYGHYVYYTNVTFRCSWVHEFLPVRKTISLPFVYESRNNPLDQ